MEAAQVTIEFTNGRVIILSTTDQQGQDIILDILAVTTPAATHMTGSGVNRRFVPRDDEVVSSNGEPEQVPAAVKPKRTQSKHLKREEVVRIFNRYVRLRLADQAVIAPGASERSATENDASHGLAVRRIVEESGYVYGVASYICNGRSYIQYTGAAPFGERYERNRHAFRYCNREVGEDGTLSWTSHATKFAKSAERRIASVAALRGFQSRLTTDSGEGQ